MKTALFLVLVTFLLFGARGDGFAQDSRFPEAAPEVPADLAGVSPSAGEGGEAPALSSILEQSGADAPAPPGEDGAPDAAMQPEIPGMELPVDEAAASPQAVKKKTPEEEEAEIRKLALKGALGGIMPLKPGEIRRLLETFDETTQASETPVYPVPEPRSAFQTISLDPGQKPIVVKTAVGQVTTLSLVDITGQPWPVQDLSWAGNFEVLQPESGSNMLRITPMAHFARGNVSMKLLGLNPPVIVTLAADRREVHVRMDVQVPEIGPNGVPPTMEGQITTKAGDSTVTGVLEGVPPSGSVRMKVAGVDGRTTAYDIAGAMYVRTPYSLLSPGWTSSAQSADGMHVYALPYTPVLVLSDRGRMLRAYLTREEQSNAQ